MAEKQKSNLSEKKIVEKSFDFYLYSWKTTGGLSLGKGIRYYCKAKHLNIPFSPGFHFQDHPFVWQILCQTFSFYHCILSILKIPLFRVLNPTSLGPSSFLIVFVFLLFVQLLLNIGANWKYMGTLKIPMSLTHPRNPEVIGLGSSMGIGIFQSSLDNPNRFINTSGPFSSSLQCKSFFPHQSSW